MIQVFDTASLTFQGGVPDNAPAILFYVDGHFANGTAARARFPHLFASGRAIGLTVFGRVPAQGDDFEPGNWRGNAGTWLKECLSRGVWRPVLYADKSDMYSVVIPELEAVVGRPLPPPGPLRHFRLLLADPDGDPTIPADMDGKQYWWASIQGRGMGVNYDISAVRDDFFPSTHPTPPEDTVAVTAIVNSSGFEEVFVELASGEVKHIWREKDDKSGSIVWHRKADGSFNWDSLGNPSQP